MGVFSSWVTAFRKLSCCSLRRTSRTRKIVLRMTPAMMKPKEDNSQDERHHFAPVENDPADVEYRRHPGDEDAKGDEERDGGFSAGDSHEVSRGG